jgi:superfamily I DNA and/or RNA helicase
LTVLDSTQPRRVIKRVEDWKLRLIDLTRRNRAIYFQPTKTSIITLLEPNTDTVYNRLLTKNGVWSIWQPPLLSPGEAPKAPSLRRSNELLPAWSDESQLEKTLRNLYRRSHSEYTERGIRVLYVTFGELRWIEKETKQEIVSPLLLTPVELFTETTRGPFKIRVPLVEDEILVNPALMLKLRYEFGIELPPLLEDDVQTPSGYIASVNELVKEFGWRTEASTYLGLFSFAKLAIYQDLTDNQDEIVKHPIIKSLSGVFQDELVQTGLPKVEELDAIVDPKSTYQILDADSSQQLCVQYALIGQSFVMQGPPGTGKSQTIANIISEYIAAGKSILFVSEKMAALEVVFNRLKEKNLDEYCLELHSYKANKREVINELNRVLVEHIKASKGMSEAEVERLVKRRNQLNSYSEALHRIRSPSSKSVYQLLNEVSDLREFQDVPSGYASFGLLDQKTIFSMEDKIRALSNNWVVVDEGSYFPWRECKTTSFTIETRSEWVNLLTAILESCKTVATKAQTYCETLMINLPKTFEDYETMQRFSRIVSSSPYPPIKWLEDADLTKIRDEAESLDGEWKAYRASRDRLNDFYDIRFNTLHPGKANRIETALLLVKEQFSDKDPEGALLRQLDALREYTDETLDIIDDWGKNAEVISKILGLSTQELTFNLCRQLVKLVELCIGDAKPERSWLDQATLDDTQKILERAKTDYRKRDDLWQKLSDYNDGVIKLDLPETIRYLEGPGSSIFKYLKPSYFNIRKVISRATKSGKVPETVLNDLQTAHELKELLSKIASEHAETEKKLGSYFKSGYIDFNGAEKAVGVAKEALDISGFARAPKALRDNLCKGTNPAEELIISSNKLKESLKNWRNKSKEFDSLLPEKIPNGKKILDTPLQELKSWIIDIASKLKDLQEETNDALVTASTTHPKTYKELLFDLWESNDLKIFEENVAEKTYLYKETYGSLYHEMSTEWNRIVNAIDWTRSFLKAAPLKFGDQLKIILTDRNTSPPSLNIEEQIIRIYTSIDQLNSSFTRRLWLKEKYALTVPEILEVVENLYSRVDDLQSWVDFKSLNVSLSELGLKNFVDQIIERKFMKRNLVNIFKKSMITGLLNHILEGDNDLKSFRGKMHDQIVDDYRSLDSNLIEETPSKVIAAANTNKPQGVFVEAQDSEISILRREAAKKRRQMPLRHLFDKIPHLIRKLKPCLMMSPISVSQFLIPGRLHFDLVVFDEASQILTEDAIGSIYRANNLIVAGDSKQLPPTPFFQYTIDSDGEWDETIDDMNVFDSVLDECTSIGLPVKMLNWHYRSRHDSLITFSNNKFYEGKLLLFPSAIHRGEGLGLEQIYVPDGVYDRGGSRNNEKEAQTVADLVFKQLKEHPSKTLGVVTFSISQMNMVKDRIEAHLAENPEFEKLLQEDRLHGFFVKNLENVQGDERDVMILSVGYGYDKKGVLSMNFGPLNKEGGERRLNVAITRAREKVILVSSIKSSDINLDSTNSAGARHLHDYLAYVESETQLKENPDEKPKDLSAIEKEIIDEVQKLGYVTVPLIGESSLKINIGVKTREEPDRYLMGIILDGEGYRSAATARDRDRLRAQILEGMGWTIYRIWSPEWVQRTSSEIKRMQEALKQAEANKKPHEVSPARSKADKKVVQRRRVSEEKSVDLPGSETYKRALLETNQDLSNIPGIQKELLIKLYRHEIKQLLPKLVKVEGPIHMDFAYKRLNLALNLKRATPTTHKVYDEEIKTMLDKRRFTRSGDFLWPDTSRLVKLRLPETSPEALVRPLEYVSPQEIEGVILHLLGHSMGLSIESTIRETLSVFNAKQSTKTKETLTLEVERLLSEKKIFRVDELLSLQGSC